MGLKHVPQSFESGLQIPHCVEGTKKSTKINFQNNPQTLLKPVKCHHDGTFVWAWEKVLHLTFKTLGEGGCNLLIIKSFIHLNGPGRRWLALTFQQNIIKPNIMISIVLVYASSSIVSHLKFAHNNKQTIECQGYKCKECSMIVHKKCIRLVNDSCTAEGALQISGR